MYIFYTDDLLSKNDTSSFFAKFQKIKQTPNNLFCIGDLSVCVVPKGQKDALKNRIVYYKRGFECPQDFMVLYGSNIDMCLIKFNNDGWLCDQIPNNRARVSLRCPAAINEDSSCSGDTKQWLCYKCQDTIWYGVKTNKFYCQKCKKQCIPETATFRCDEDLHGLDFVEYPHDFLFNDISKLRESKYLNILILGETGVGKSTFINGFANYLYFDSLEEANTLFPVVAIPSQFTYTDSNGKTTNVLIGKTDDNEKLAVGSSATQESKTYPFPIDDCIVNLIDTPGMCDTRGLKQDDKNMDNILSHISFYEEIHAILVLLKPDNARLGIFFKHCIQQLLAHLHKEASNNIVFVFTNTRQTFYQPGETLPLLRKLIKDKNMDIDAVRENIFCYDNEAFKFLACMQNGISFNPDLIEIYEKSWKKACDVTKDLLCHIQSLKPHHVMNTTTLNDARRVIIELSRPLQEFAKEVRKNIRKIENIKKEADSLGDEENNFFLKLKFEGVTLEQHDLDYPRTVCTHVDCVEFVPVGKDQIHQKNYITHCHTKCFLGEHIKPEMVGDEMLMKCSAMKDNYCTKCTHSYASHMHRTYDLHKIKKSFVSDGVQSKLDSVKNKRQLAFEKKLELETLVKELKYEEKEIQNFAAHFAVFLKTFAIIPFNDAMGDYIEALIKEEKEKSDVDQNMTLVQDWENYKSEYEVQKKFIEKSLAKVKDTDKGKADAATSIKEIQQRAFELKHFGKDIMRVFKKIDERKQQMYTFKHGIVPSPPIKKIKAIYQRGQEFIGRKKNRFTKRN